MKTNCTINDFKVNEYAYKPIIETGRMESSGHYYINCSSALTRLIQEAGRFCENYASDLFIHWDRVRNAVDKMTADDVARVSFLLGFRRDGVDNEGYILSHFSQPGATRDHYRSLWRIDISADGEVIKMTTGRVF